MSIKVLAGDCRQTLQSLEPDSVQAVITSPPYYSLRDYGTSPLIWGGEPFHDHAWGTELRVNGSAQTQGATSQRQGRANVEAQRSRDRSQGQFCDCGAWLGSLGLEPTVDLYVAHLVEVFRAIRRVLRPDGVLWLNLGDSYAASRGYQVPDSKHVDVGNARPAKVPAGYKRKDLLLIPFRVAMALQADGWYLRSAIPWIKRSAMPESVRDRPSNAVEHVFLLSKSEFYFWDTTAARAAGAEPDRVRRNERIGGANGHVVRHGEQGLMNGSSVTRNLRNADFFMQSWQGLLLDDHGEPLALVVNPMPNTLAHFATFPPKLVEPMITAATSEIGQCPGCGMPWVRESTKTPNNAGYAHGPGGSRHHFNDTDRGTLGSVARWHVRTVGWHPGCAHDLEPQPQTVLDPFAGSGTVGLVADRLGRHAVLGELQPDYTEIASERITGDAPLFVQMELGSDPW